ncbi:MAG: MBL fold metallo-hydrolase [Nitrospirae bacterium]|nr:MBL fold metallo-hydrolase [Nitrospirota bacterium]
MISISLQSGSNGNCTYVESNGAKLLFDAGISSIEASCRLAAFGRDIKNVDALIISHDHSDHVRFAGVYQRRFGIPVYITQKTMDSAMSRLRMGKMNDINYFKAGENLRFGSVSVQTIPSPHDGVDGSVFVVSSSEKRLGILTDLGHVFRELITIIESLDAVFIESNYDPEMLTTGPYPYFLKNRIQGPKGHISNQEAAELLLSGSRLKWACLAHLSNNNNDPAIAINTHRKILGEGLPLYTASRFAATGILSL